MTVPLRFLIPGFGASAGSAVRPVEAGAVRPLSGGLIALALVAGLDIAATMAMTATTVLHLSWPAVAFHALAAALLAALVLAQARNFSAANAAFVLGVACAILPALVIAAQHATDHWDDFMTWLGNAHYIFSFGAFPAATRRLGLARLSARLLHRPCRDLERCRPRRRERGPDHQRRLPRPSSRAGLARHRTRAARRSRPSPRRRDVGTGGDHSQCRTRLALGAVVAARYGDARGVRGRLRAGG